MLKSFSARRFLSAHVESCSHGAEEFAGAARSRCQGRSSEGGEEWSDSILRRDIECAGSFLAEDYFLMIAIEGQPLVKVSRELWLKNLAGYYIEAMSIDETHISIYSDTAVATLRYSQKAHTAGNRDITGNFMLTDVWIKTATGWKIAERHSCRAEKLPQNASH